MTTTTTYATANTPENVAEVINGHPALIAAAIVAIYFRQTATEQAGRFTQADNGRGFSRNDAGYGSYLAEYALRRRRDWVVNGYVRRRGNPNADLLTFTGSYARSAQRLVHRYRRQLLEEYMAGTFRNVRCNLPVPFAPASEREEADFGPSPRSRRDEIAAAFEALENGANRVEVDTAQATDRRGRDINRERPERTPRQRRQAIEGMRSRNLMDVNDALARMADIMDETPANRWESLELDAAPTGKVTKRLETSDRFAGLELD